MEELGGAQLNVMAGNLDAHASIERRDQQQREARSEKKEKKKKEKKRKGKQSQETRDADPVAGFVGSVHFSLQMRVFSMVARMGDGVDEPMRLGQAVGLSEGGPAGLHEGDRLRRLTWPRAKGTKRKTGG